MKKKKNRFWLFVFSLWPGAGHMYIGFMKMGLSFMLGFLFSLALVGVTNLGWLAVFPITIYVYAFFHANNLGGLDDEEFADIKDEYLFGFADMGQYRLKLNGKNRSIAAAVLIIVGLCMLWNVAFGMFMDYVGMENPVVRMIYYTVRDELPRAVLALVIIWVGVRLLRGKKDTVAQTEVIEQKEKEESVQEGAPSAETPVMQIEHRKEQAEDGQENEGQQDGQLDEQREA